MRFAFFLSVLSGLLLTAGFPRLELPFLSWFALVPLLVAVRGRSGKDAFTLGYVCGVVHFATTLYWIRYVVNHYGGVPLAAALVVLLLLCAYLALYPALFAFLAQRWEGQPRLWVWGLPIVWVALEWIRAHLMTGFPWANFGYTQTPTSLLVQVADITGVYGISWILVFANTCVASYLLRQRVHGGPAFFVVCLVSALVYGGWRLDGVRELQAGAPGLPVAVIQGNIEQSLKWDAAFQQETLERYRQLSLAAMGHDPQPGLVVWPETSAPFLFGIEREPTLEVLNIVREAGVPLLFGSPGAEKIGGEVRFKNMAYLLGERGELLGEYAKQHLVPFGEYVPLKQVLFFVHRMVAAAGDFISGNDPAPLELNGWRLGVLICYEGIFPGLARDTVNMGSSLLANITNDAWFGNSSAPYQHLEMSNWRAVEFRTPLIRAANTGVSAIFDATGRPCGTIPLNEEGYLVCTVRPVNIVTFYAKWGDLFAWSCFFAALAMVAFTFRPVRFARRLRRLPGETGAPGDQAGYSQIHQSAMEEKENAGKDSPGSL